MAKKKPKKKKKKRRAKGPSLLEDRLTLALLEAGGQPERPLEVSTAAIVESRAEGLGCAVCDGPLRTESHDALTVEEVSLRRVRAVCTSCGAKREVWVRIVGAALN